MNNTQMFSRFMSEGLDSEFWGSIDPGLFHEIAENNSFEELSEDARSLANIIEKSLRLLGDGDN
jgi:hypothetical protein